MVTPKQMLTVITYPRDVDWLERDSEVIKAHIIGGYRPQQPPLKPTDTIACIGSCFAAEIAKNLADQGRSVLTLSMSERWNTPYALRYFLQSAFDGTPMPAGYVPDNFQPDSSDEAKKSIATADAFIMTLGLSVVWTEVASGKMILEPRLGHSAKALINAMNTHVMRQMDVREIENEITTSIACIRRVKPTAPIILTLSPIPFLVALTDHPVVAANTVSKASLRVALHTIWQQKMPNVYYWPAYDIIDWIGSRRELIYGKDGADLRHLKPSVVAEIMALFTRFYFPGAAA